MLDGQFSIKVTSKKTSFVFGNTRTKDYTVSGNIRRSIDSYSHDASVSFDDHLSEKLAPYDPAAKRPFNPSYLCGFYAEAGDASEMEYRNKADDELEKHCFEIITQDSKVSKKLPNKRTLSYKTGNASLPIKDKQTELGLFPVWFMSYRHKNKITYAAVNGQTGKVSADLPLSPLRILIAALVASAAIFDLLFLFMAFLPSLKAKTALGVCSMLMMGGLFVMQNAFYQTVNNALNTANRDSLGVRLSLRYFFLLAGTMISIIGFTSDGSYQGDIRALSVLGFIVFVIPLFQFHLAQGRELRQFRKLKPQTESLLNNGIITVAKKLTIPLLIIRLAVYATTVLHLVVVLNDVPRNIVYYLLCGTVTAELFAMSFLHIFFQSSVAKRRPPQFNKKGAYYDKK